MVAIRWPAGSITGAEKGAFVTPLSLISVTTHESARRLSCHSTFPETEIRRS
jgi:hypothetical protein